MIGGNVSCTASLFLPTFWSVFEQMELGISRTQNRIEEWHRQFGNLVFKNFSVYSIIEEIKK